MSLRRSFDWPDTDLHALQIQTSFRIHWRVSTTVCWFLIYFWFFARFWRVCLPVFLSPHAIHLPVCFGNFFCGLLKSALRTSRAARVDYQSVIHHFDGLLQPHSDPSPLLLFTCLAHSPVKKSHASSRIASCNWIFYPDCRSLGKKRSDCDLQQQGNLHVAWNSSGTQQRATV